MAQKAHLQMEQGADFSAQIDLQSYIGTMYNLSGAVITSQMRKSWVSTVSYPFECTIDNVTNGSFIISMPWELTSTIDAGRYLYDIVLTDTNTGGKIRVIEGTVHVTPGITRQD